MEDNTISVIKRVRPAEKGRIELLKINLVTTVAKRTEKRGLSIHFARGVSIFVTLSKRIILREALKSSVINITAT